MDNPERFSIRECFDENSTCVTRKYVPVFDNMIEFLCNSSIECLVSILLKNLEKIGNIDFYFTKAGSNWLIVSFKDRISLDIAIESFLRHLEQDLNFNLSGISAHKVIESDWNSLDLSVYQRKYTKKSNISPLSIKWPIKSKIESLYILKQ